MIKVIFSIVHFNHLDVMSSIKMEAKKVLEDASKEYTPQCEPRSDYLSCAIYLRFVQE